MSKQFFEWEHSKARTVRLLQEKLEDPDLTPEQREQYRKYGREWRSMSVKEWEEGPQAHMLRAGPSGIIARYAAAEKLHAYVGRPYYLLWSELTESLCRTPIEKLSVSQLRFPKECTTLKKIEEPSPFAGFGEISISSLEIRLEKGTQVRFAEEENFSEGLADALNCQIEVIVVSTFGGEKVKDNASLNVLVQASVEIDGKRHSVPFDFKAPLRGLIGDAVLSDESRHVTETINGCGNLTDDVYRKLGQSAVMKSLRIAAGCLLLDDELVERDVLSRDLGKPVTDEIVERAIRRGKNGWQVGRICSREHAERAGMSAHWRNPHLAHVWHGPGKSQVKLVLRKGALVNRDKLLEIPTGFGDPTVVV